jgi:hypothetical protein
MSLVCESAAPQGADLHINALVLVGSERQRFQNFVARGPSNTVHVTCVHTYTNTKQCDAHMHTCTHAHMHTCTHAHMHTCTHAHMHKVNNTRNLGQRTHKHKYCALEEEDIHIRARSTAAQNVHTVTCFGLRTRFTSCKSRSFSSTNLPISVTLRCTS